MGLVVGVVGGVAVVGAVTCGVAAVVVVVTGSELVVGGVVAGLKKLCKGVSGAVPGLVSEGKLHL